MARPLSRSSAVFALAVELHQRHVPDGAGRCRACGSRPCPVRLRSAGVIRAAGVDLPGFDLGDQSRRGDAAWERTAPLPMSSVRADWWTG